DLVQRDREVSLFEILEHGIVRAVPGLEDGVGGDVDGQVAAVDAVQHLRETGGPHALADDEAILLEGGQFLLIEVEIVTAASLSARRGGLLELIEELAGGGVPGQLVEIRGLRGEALGKVSGRDLADLLERLVEGGAVAENLLVLRRLGRLL